MVKGIICPESPILENRPEKKSFLRSALAWHGSATPIVLPRVIFAAIYSVAIILFVNHDPSYMVPITPFEYSGVVLGLLLVLRVNAGMDRWWEARKIWGSIVNQSRNLAIIGTVYPTKKNLLMKEYLHWIAAWPHIIREVLRDSRDLTSVQHLLSREQVSEIQSSQHMGVYVGFKITEILAKMREFGLDEFAFHRAESEKSGLIDSLGGCERIKNTRMPLALAIKTRRFILMFLLLLPFALADRTGLFTAVVVVLVAYPLFTLDEIGAELQNPFSKHNLSHLPIDTICRNIEANVLALIPYVLENRDAASDFKLQKDFLVSSLERLQKVEWSNMDQ